MSRGGRRCTVLCAGIRLRQTSSPHRYNYPNRCGWNRRTLSAGPRSRGIDGDGDWNCGGGGWCSRYCTVVLMRIVIVDIGPGLLGTDLADWAADVGG